MCGVDIRRSVKQRVTALEGKFTQHPHKLDITIAGSALTVTRTWWAAQRYGSIDISHRGRRQVDAWALMGQLPRGGVCPTGQETTILNPSWLERGNILANWIPRSCLPAPSEYRRP